MNFDTDWSEFLAAVAAPGQPTPAFDALKALVRQAAGAKLFTVMTYDGATQMAQRAYTSHPQDYPVGGAKPLSVGLWSRTVVERRQPFVANSIEAIAEVFPDHPLILSLGCESVVNLPALFNGDVIGTVNCLDARGYYTPERVAALAALAPFATMALIGARGVR